MLFVADGVGGGAVADVAVVDVIAGMMMGAPIGIWSPLAIHFLYIVLLFPY